MEETTSTPNKSGNTNKVIGTVLVLAVLLFAGWAFIGKQMLQQNSAATTTQPNVTQKAQEVVVTTTPEAMESVTPEATGGAMKETSTTTSAVKTFNVTGENFNFSLAEMKVKVGDKVKVVFTNSEGMHDWVVDEFNARTKVIPEGQTDTVEFVASKKGTFEYYCSVGSHRAQGMKGNLIVQ